MTSVPNQKLPTAKRTGRMSSLPLSAFLTVKIAESGKSNTEIADAVGYPRPNVIAMLKTGSMRLPLNKVAPMAKVLEIDPVFLLEKVMNESSPDLWEALRSVISDRLFTSNEQKLIDFVRKHLNGVDADVTAYTDFIKPMADGLKEIARHQVASTSATLNALERDSRRKTA